MREQEGLDRNEDRRHDGRRGEGKEVKEDWEGYQRKERREELSSYLVSSGCL